MQGFVLEFSLPYCCSTLAFDLWPPYSLLPTPTSP